MKKEFPFTDAPDTACFTCRHILDDKEPVLYISHDEDGYWQFLCGRKHHSISDGRIVSLAYMVEAAPEITDLVQLDYGYCAEAEDEDSDWVVRKNSE